MERFIEFSFSGNNGRERAIVKASDIQFVGGAQMSILAPNGESQISYDEYERLRSLLVEPEFRLQGRIHDVRWTSHRTSSPYSGEETT